MTDEKDYGENLLAPTQRVSHASLARVSGSVFRSKCPACPDGVLFVRRTRELHLSNVDRCICCGQRFVYTDASIAGCPLVNDDWNER